MNTSVLDFEPFLRLGVFFGVFLALAVTEAGFPRRPAVISRRARWPNNLGVVAVDTLALRLLFPAGAVAAAGFAGEARWGLLNAVALPDWAGMVVTVVLLDLVIWGQHVVFHKVPFLWRLHRMHHTDPHVDVTTGLRFHPVEIVLSGLLKMGVVIALGAPPTGVVVFEILLNATAMFNHANLRLPARLDAVLRLFVVTPDMHRVHHSVIRAETDSNYGFNLPWWDRLFGTYRPQPDQGHDGMTLGQDRFREAADQRLDRLLLQPLRRL